MTATWLCVADPDPRPFAHMKAELVEGGLRLVAWDPEERQDSPGLVLFEECTEVLHHLLGRCSRANLPVLAVAASAESYGRCDPWMLLAMGATDVLAWRGSDSAAEIRGRLERWAAIDEVVCSLRVSDRIVGSSPAWRATLRSAAELALFTTAPVLVSGESGTGKELVARLIHDLSPAAGTGKLIVLDCTTVVSSLSGSEFFGHERGAFTGAVTARDGAFGLADRGTLFLDEVGELPLPMQAELLRVIQERTYKRIGSNVWQRTDFRLVCATNRDLLEECEAGRFRRDLYYRITGGVLGLPPLRERRDDIPALFRYFLAEFLSTPPDVSAEVALYLRGRDYPGNVRDLRQLAARVAMRHVGGGVITPGDLPVDDRPTSLPKADAGAVPLEGAVRAALASGLSLREIRELAGDLAVQAAMIDANGNLHQAAQMLDVTERALQMRRAKARSGVSDGVAALLTSDNGQA